MAGGDQDLREPAAALFDLDGTLVDREPLTAAAVRRVTESQGWAISAGRLGSWVGRSWREVHAGLDVADRTGWDLDEWVGRVLDAADELLAEGFAVRTLTGGGELLRRLADRGVPIAVVTGSTHRELRSAEAGLAIGHLISDRVAAEDYETGKPDPACYLLAARRLAVRPARCVVFEDSAAGVAAARAAGMAVVATAEANAPQGSPAHQDLSAAHVVVASLGEVDEAVIRAALATAARDDNWRRQ